MSKPCTSGATYTNAIICLLRPTQRLIRPAASHEVSELFRRPVMKDNVVPMPNANVLVRGTIRGMGRRGPCELLVRRQRRAGSTAFEYTQWTVLSAPADLPDGNYVVTTEDGYNFHVTRAHRIWRQASPRRTRESA